VVVLPGLVGVIPQSGNPRIPVEQESDGDVGPLLDGDELEWSLGALELCDADECELDDEWLRLCVALWW
jgi:hypothetical protein